jgi:hypothetical protein
VEHRFIASTTVPTPGTIASIQRICSHTGSESISLRFKYSTSGRPRSSTRSKRRICLPRHGQKE